MDEFNWIKPGIKVGIESGEFRGYRAVIIRGPNSDISFTRQPMVSIEILNGALEGRKKNIFAHRVRPLGEEVLDPNTMFRFSKANRRR